MARKRHTETTEPTDQPRQGKPPVHEVRIGRVRCTIWENEDPERGPWFSATFTRSYKQGDEWKTAQSFGRDDMLVVAEVARLAFLWIAIQQGAPGVWTGQSTGAAHQEDEQIPI